MRFLGLVAVLLLLCFPVVAQSKVGAAPSAPQTVVAGQPAAPVVHTTDTPDAVRETQQGIREKDYVGLVWWIPFEYWEQTAGAKAAENLKALKDYTLVAVFAGKLSPFGAVDFIPGADLRKKVVLRDGNGNEYRVSSEPSQDAQLLSATLKPIFANAMGRAGENIEMLFFPARTKTGDQIASPSRRGTFAIVLRDVAGVPESIYQWRTPLTSFTPPKYCPVGKERVNANWDYCPWHGVPLNPTQGSPK